MLIIDTRYGRNGGRFSHSCSIWFPAGSSLVAFAGATGIMPLDMPEFVLH